MVGSFLSLAPKSSATDFVIFLVFETIWFPMTFQSFHAHNLWPVFRGSSQRLTWFFCLPFILLGKKILKLFTYMAFQEGKRNLENSITFQFFPWCIWTLVYSYGVVGRIFFKYHLFSLLPWIQCTLPCFFIRDSIHRKRGHPFKLSHSTAKTTGSVHGF